MLVSRPTKKQFRGRYVEFYELNSTAYYFGRFVTTWYNVHCKHTLFFGFWGLLNDFLRSLVLGVRVWFGGREGALASALIYHTAILLK